MIPPVSPTSPVSTAQPAGQAEEVDRTGQTSLADKAAKAADVKGGPPKKEDALKLIGLTIVRDYFMAKDEDDPTKMPDKLDV